MASNDFSQASSSDSEVSEIEDFELEVEDSPNLSDQATDVEERQEAYADEPLADAEWLASYEQERRTEEELEKTLQKRLYGTEEVRDYWIIGLLLDYWYWMKLNAFLLVSNVATAKYNTLLRHNFSSD